MGVEPLCAFLFSLRASETPKTLGFLFRVMSQRFIYTRCSVLRISRSSYSMSLCCLPVLQTCKVGNMTFTFRITLRYLPPRLRHIYSSFPMFILSGSKSYFLFGNFLMFYFLENILPNVGRDIRKIISYSIDSRSIGTRNE